MMENLNTWWDGLALIAKVFYTIGMFSTAVLGVQTFLTLIGLDGDDAVDAADAMDGGEIPDEVGDGDLQFLSLRTITAFLVGFGWVGASLIKAGLSIVAVIAIAFCVGLVLMFGIFYLMKFFWAMRQDGTLDYRNAIGEIGSVYLPIPGGKAGKGQIEVMIQGRLQTVQAITSAPERIGNRKKVLVIDRLEDNTLLVIPDETGSTLT